MLVNAQSLILNYDQHLTDNDFDLKTEKALVKLCKTQATSLEISNFSFLPYYDLLESKQLRSLALHAKSSMTVLGSDAPKERLRLNTLRVGKVPHGSWLFAGPESDKAEPGLDASRSEWIMEPNSAVDLTQLERLEIYRPSMLRPEDVFPRCASTLKDLVLDKAFGVRYEVFGQPIDWRRPESGEKLPDFSLLRSLVRVELVAFFDSSRSPNSPFYLTTLGGLCESLQTIPTNSTITTITIHVKIRHILEARVMELDLSPLSETLVVYSEGMPELRLANLDCVELIFHHGFVPTPPLHTLKGLSTLKRLGILSTNTIYMPIF